MRERNALSHQLMAERQCSKQCMVACRFADQQCSLFKNRRTRRRSDQSIGLPSFIFTEGWFDVRDHEARGQSVLELCEWPSPLRLVLVFPVVAVSPIWNRHLHKPGSINRRVNSTPLRIVVSAAFWWSVMGDVLCSKGINPLLELAFQ